jgi:uncharacterized tellurite resistance protein B-like protein
LFDSLKKLFRNTENNLNKSFDDLQLLSGLMIEAANIDGIIDQKEINKISKSLVEIFGEKPQAVEIELNKCLDEINDHKSLHFYTSRINQTFTEEKKIILIEILWEIILEDGKIHDFETNLIRRLAGLLYISDTQCGKAKKKILEKFQIKD